MPLLIFCCEIKMSTNPLLPTCPDDSKELNPVIGLLLEKAVEIMGEDLFVDKDRLIQKRKVSIEYQALINELYTHCLMEHKTEHNLHCVDEVLHAPLSDQFVENVPGRSYVTIFFSPDDPAHCIVTGAKKPYDIIKRVNRYIERNRRSMELYRITRSTKERMVSDVYLSVNIKKFVADHEFKQLRVVVIGHYLPNGRSGLQPMLSRKMRQFISKITTDDDYKEKVKAHAVYTH